MAGDGRLAAHLDEVLQHRGAGDADLGHDHAAAAELHVVGDVHQVIQPAAVADHGVVQAAPVDGAAGADLDVRADHHAAEMGHGAQALAGAGQAEAFLADAHARMQATARADHRVADHGAGADTAIFFHRHAFLQDHMRPDAAARAHHNALADIGEGADLGGVVHLGAGRDIGGRVAARLQRGQGMEQAHHLGPGLGRGGGDDGHSARWNLVDQARVDDHRAGRGVVQQPLIAGAVQVASMSEAAAFCRGATPLSMASEPGQDEPMAVATSATL